MAGIGWFSGFLQARVAARLQETGYVSHANTEYPGEIACCTCQ
jgi:hypothetical protein